MIKPQLIAAAEDVSRAQRAGVPAQELEARRFSPFSRRFCSHWITIEITLTEHMFLMWKCFPMLKELCKSHPRRQKWSRLSGLKSDGRLSSRPSPSKQSADTTESLAEPHIDYVSPELQVSFAIGVLGQKQLPADDDR